MNNALKDSAYERVSNAIAAGTDDTTNCTVVDMAGYDAVEFITAVGAITATGTLNVKLQQGAESDLSDAADLEGSNQAYTDADDNKIMIHDLVRPQERYVRVVLIRATANVVIDGVFARKYRAKSKPTTQSSSHVVGSELHVSPAEGTA